MGVMIKNLLAGFDFTLGLDFETASKVNLKKHGIWRYATHPSTKVLMLAWEFNGDGIVHQWCPHEGPMPKELRAALLNPKVLKTAENYVFEMLIFLHVLGIDIPIEQWEDTMALAYQRSLPGDLDTLMKAIGKEELMKDKRGKKLIDLFCKPRPAKHITAKKPWEFNDWTTHPKEWEEFKGYNKQDVRAESGARKILLNYPIPEFEREIWLLDQRTNLEGVPIDLEFVNAAWAMVQSERKLRIARIEKITGLSNGNAPKQLLPWLQERGYPFNDLTKESVAAAIKDFTYDDPDVMKVLRLRSEIAKTSVDKYRQMLDIQADGLIRFAFQYGGAQRTLRWAGRKPQLQNLPSRFADLWLQNQAEIRQMVIDGDSLGIELKFGDVLTALSTLIRTAIKSHDEDEVVCCADLGSIESRGLGEISKCQRIFDIFENGLDMYKDFASFMFKKPYDEVTKAERTICKPPVLGSGYGLGAGEARGTYPLIEYTGLIGYAKNMGVDMTKEEAELGTKIFRKDLYPQVEDAWYAIQNAAVRAIKTMKPQRAITRNGAHLDVWFDFKRPFLRMQLPSGRHIHYLRPQVHEEIVTIRKGPRKGETFVADKITYEGYDDKKRWTRIETRGAKFLENWVQAWARDIMADQMVRIAKIVYKSTGERAFRLLGSVHDELITLIKKSHADYLLKKLIAMMSSKPKTWEVAICLGAAGFVSPWYKKD